MCKWGDDVNLLVLIPAERSHTGAAYWRWMGVDRCIAPIVDALNKAGVFTSCSCCGHGVGDGYIYLHDGRVLVIPIGGYKMRHTLKENYLWYRRGSDVRARKGRLASIWFAIRAAIRDARDMLHAEQQADKIQPK